MAARSDSGDGAPVCSKVVVAHRRLSMVLDSMDETAESCDSWVSPGFSGVRHPVFTAPTGASAHRLPRRRRRNRTRTLEPAVRERTCHGRGSVLVPDVSENGTKAAGPRSAAPANGVISALLKTRGGQPRAFVPNSDMSCRHPLAAFEADRLLAGASSGPSSWSDCLTTWQMSAPSRSEPSLRGDLCTHRAQVRHCGLGFGCGRRVE